MKLVLAVTFMFLLLSQNALSADDWAQETQSIGAEDNSSRKSVGMFEFKGKPLGISLEEWQKSPYPSISDRVVSVVPVDAPSAYFKDALCFKIKLKDSADKECPTTIANFPCDNQWLFRKDRVGTHRLMMIVLACTSNAYPKVAQALRQKYGAAQNMTDEIYWEVGSSRLECYRRHGSCVIRFINRDLLPADQPPTSLDL